jgi:hypothetical protein
MMNVKGTDDKVWIVMWRRHGEVMLNGAYRTKRDAYCALLWIYKHEKEAQEWDKETSDTHFSHLIRTYKNSTIFFGNLDIAFAEKMTVLTVED